MSVAPAVLFHGVVAIAPGVVYTVPAGPDVVLRRCLFTAAAAAAATLTIGGKLVVATEPVAANRRLEQVLTYRLAAGSTVEAASSVVGALTLLLEGFYL